MSRTEDEFAEFLTDAEPRLASYLHYATGGADHAEDVFQDACVAAYRNWRRVRELERPAAWLVRVARNLLVNRYRKNVVRRRPVLREERSATASDIAAGASEAREAVGAAVAALPDREREAVSMKIWGGLSWVEIGRILEVSEDTAARLFARGLKTLAPKLEGFAP